VAVNQKPVRDSVGGLMLLDDSAFIYRSLKRVWDDGQEARPPFIRCDCVRIQVGPPRGPATFIEVSVGECLHGMVER